MKTRHFLTSKLFVAAFAIVATVASIPWVAVARADDAPVINGSSSALAARFAAMKGELASSPFKRPIVLSSREGNDLLSGEVYAIVDQPFAATGAALKEPAQWCEVLILHLNTKQCKPAIDANGPQLQVSVRKKFDQPIEKAFRVDFTYKVVARTENYLQVKLNAEQGPLSTRNYRIVLEATPASGHQTYLRLSYSYGYGMIAQIAMKAYLGTVGRNKVGFTLVDDSQSGTAQPVGGMRGVVERNTMRYYLAIEAYLGALNAPPSQRVEKSFKDWYDATEHYPRQLHEMEQAEYLDMKRKEYQRQRVQG